MNATCESSNSFDLVRLSKSKETVDFAPNTIRAYAKEGLNLYKKGKACFFSKSELEHFLKTSGKVVA